MSSYKGVNGSLHVEQDAVVFTREGLAARGTFGKDSPPRRVPLSEIIGVVHRPAGRIANGSVQLVREGQEPAASAAKDPDGIQYAPQKRQEFEQLVTWLSSVAAKNNPAAAAAAAETATSTRIATSGAKPGWYQKRGAQLAGATLLGLLLGSCAGGDDEQIERLQAAQASSEDRVETLEDRLGDAEDRAEKAERALDRVNKDNAKLKTQLVDAQQAADDARADAAVVQQVAPPPPVEEVAPAQAAEPAPAEVYYANCAEVRAAGAAPIRRGEPGYRSGLDRDGDGVACDT